MEITDTTKNLIELLLDIDENDDDFVRFVVSAAGIDENRETLIAYIKTKRLRKEPLDKSLITKISIKMAQNLQEGKGALKRA